ncbi:MAG TPA: hypothetical protein IAB35_02175 [Candidatus Faecimonas gallistercoris]|nr:hypothetical protein [Candidatus Faecimonas gallistercoris]
MELIGKIQKKINDSSGYILGQDNKLYLYFCYDFLEDFADEIGQKVFFRAEGGKILRATYISKFTSDDLQDI